MLSDLKRLWRELKEDLRGAIDQGRADADRAKWQRDHPGLTPIGDDEADAMSDWYRSLARPALLLATDPALDAAASAARIGGPAWLADGEDWPLDASGQRLEFVAQLDFARLPRLAGFPDAGVLRVFVGRDELFGANWDQPEQNGCRLLWHAGPASGGRDEPPAPLSDDDMSPFESISLRTAGRALVATAIEDVPDVDAVEVDTHLAGHRDRWGFADVEDELYELSEERVPGHRIGGYPMFTQPDFRRPGYHDDYDVLLLGLTSDDALMWGDVGEAMFLMRQADLDARDFSRVIFYWDCH